MKLETSGRKDSLNTTRVATPNDPKLSDGGGWRDGCAGEGGGAASVTAAAVRCSAWLGDVGIANKRGMGKTTGGKTKHRYESYREEKSVTQSRLLRDALHLVSDGIIDSCDGRKPEFPKTGR